MGNVNNQNVRSFDDYSKNAWTNFLKQGSYRGLKINKVAKRLKKAESCVYDKKTHTLELIYEQGSKKITLNMDKLFKKNDRWTLSRLLHNFRMCFSKSNYALKFNNRMTKLAEVITKNTFSLELNQFVDDQIIDDHNLAQIEIFFNKNLRIINESIGNKEIRDNLLKLSDKTFEKSNTAESRALAFQIQSTAISLVPDKDLVWETLPGDVQNLIFSKSCNFSGKNTDQPLNQLLVSKQVNKNVSVVKNNWINDNDFCLSTIGCKTCKEAVKYIIDHQLTSVNLSAFKDLDDEDLEELSINCPRLEKLSIRSNKISSDKLAELLENLTNLQSLNLSECRKISGDKLAESLGNLTVLQRLNLNECWQLNGDKIAEEIGKLHNLQRLNLSRCHQISGDLLILIAEKLPNLQSLNLSGCREIDKDKLAEGIGKLHNLLSLNVSGCWQITGDEVVGIAEKLSMLKSLNLSWCGEISGDQLAEALEKLPLLQSLNLGSYYGDQFVDAIGKLTMLQSLTLSQPSGDQLVKIAEKLPRLLSLDIGSCWYISGDQLEDVLGKLPMLQTLNLTDSKISGDQLADALEKVSMLQTLNLYIWKKITGDQLVKIAEKLPRLQILNLHGCKKIDKNKLEEAVEKLPLLQSVTHKYVDT